MRPLFLAIVLLLFTNAFATICTSIPYASRSDIHFAATSPQRIKIAVDEDFTAMVVYARGASTRYALNPVGHEREHAFACAGIPFGICNIQFLQHGAVTAAVLPWIGAVSLMCE